VHQAISVRAVPGVSPATVLRLYDEGVDAFAAAAGALGPGDWDRPACGSWTASDLARHVLAVARWYDGWLQRAERGDTAPPFGGSELAARNAAELEKLSGLDGPEAVERFVTTAYLYRDRLPGQWDLPYGYPRGTVTAGLHAGTAACEWHLHTWDLAQAMGRGHRPSDPAALYAAAGACLAAAEGGAKGKVAAVLVPLGARLRPWEALLRRSGRAPGPDD
jgi:uncharacterized protein (TIGR03083 family)